MPQPEHILEVRELSVRFGATRVLDNLAFTVQPGLSLAIIGPNGVGKSVLLRAAPWLDPRRRPHSLESVSTNWLRASEAGP